MSEPTGKPTASPTSSSPDSLGSGARKVYDFFVRHGLRVELVRGGPLARADRPGLDRRRIPLDPKKWGG